MRTHLFCFIPALLIILFFSTTKAQAQVVNIPDPNFLARLIDEGVDLNGDGMIQHEEAESETSLNLFRANIRSLEGISAFINLEWLSCSENQISSLDLSKNTELTDLFCHGNQLKVLDLSQNLNLKLLHCAKNLLTELELTKHLDLYYLDCAENQLSTLNLSQNDILRQLFCSDNQLSSLDVTQNVKLISIYCSKNKLSNLDVTQNVNLRVLVCSSNQLSSLDLTQNVNLEGLACSTNNLSSLDVTKNVNLERLYCSENQLTNLDVTQNVNLEWFECDFNQLSSLDVTQNVNLVELWCSFNNLSSLDVMRNVNLKELSCFSNRLSSLDVTQNQNLKQLDCSINNLSSLDVTQNVNLVELVCRNNNLSSLDVTQNVNLEELVCRNNNLSRLDVMQNVNLASLNCNSNNLSSLDVTQNVNLERLNCGSNNLNSLDVTQNMNLERLYCKGSDSLSYINLKNGGVLPERGTFFGLHIENCPSLQYICIDEGERAVVQTEVDRNNYDCVISTNCSFTPGGDYYTLTLTQKFEEQSDSCQNQGQLINSKYVVIQDRDTNYFFSSYLDSTRLYVQDGDILQIRPSLAHPAYFAVSPSYYEVVMPRDSQLRHLEFCLQPVGRVHNLEVHLYSKDFARPGFIAEYGLQYVNQGNQTEEGTIVLDFPCDSVQFVSSSPSPDQVDSCQLRWNFSSLQPFESREIHLEFELNRPTASQHPLLGGEILKYHAAIDYAHTAQDSTPQDNQFTLCQDVVNAYDPNDKTCLQGNSITPDMIGEYVHYRIRFENTGSASAVNVVITDSIDTETFDISSLQVLSASDSMYTRINGNLVEFIFENIYLPFDDANNDGYVIFKIKTWPHLKLNDSLLNQAGIYFDFNPPIITNEEQTVIQEEEPNSTYIHPIELGITAYPQPASEVLYIDSKHPIKGIECYQLDGRKVANFPADTRLEVGQLASGVYLFKVHTTAGVGVLKVVKE